MVFPLTDNGLEGEVPGNIVNVEAGELEPQLLFAVTDTVPEFVPTVVVILVVVDVPDQPPGNVQV